MYCQRIITRTLDRFAAEKGNFTPEPHSVMECERANAHFRSIVEIERNEYGQISSITGKRNPSLPWRETLTPEERRWLRNETVLSRADFRYWVTRYVRIKSDEDREVLMQLWPGQEIFMHMVTEMEEWEFAIWFFILKGRQLGISRIISLIMLHRVLFRPNVNCYMASSTEEKTGKLFDMSDFVMQHLPFWMFADCERKKFRKEGKLLELHNNSAISLQHGQQGTGIARGTTPTVAHISELSEFDNPSETIDASLIRAMHPSTHSFRAFEGTAKGINNWFHDNWELTKAGWPQRTVLDRPLFLPWFTGGLYPKPIHLRTNPMPADYAAHMKDWALRHAKMAEQFVRSTDYLCRELGSNWTMPLEQVWFYECQREIAVRKNKIETFLQEMPATDDEAFQSTNISVFEVDTINLYRDSAKTIPLWGVFGLRGPVELIPARLQPSALSIDANKPPIPIRCETGGGSTITLELVPMRFGGWSLEGDSAKGSIDKIYVAEPPLDGYEYGIGCDTGDGIDKDRTVMEGVRKYSLDGPTKQVFEFASGHMNALDAWPFLLALGTWYSTCDEYGSKRQPRMAIECRGHGDIVQNIIRMMGWSNFHPWNDKQIDDKKVDRSKFHKIGVFTNFWFRAGMIEMLVKMLRDCELEIFSPFFVKEMQSLEGDEVDQSLRAGYGGHDDRIMALGFILVSLYRWDVNYWRNARVAAYRGKNPLAANGTDGREQSIAGVCNNWVYGAQQRSDLTLEQSSPGLIAPGYPGHAGSGWPGGRRFGKVSGARY